jgi:hypothetical protein
MEEFAKVGVIRLVIKSQSPDIVEEACECIREAMVKILNRGIHLFLFDMFVSLIL